MIQGFMYWIRSRDEGIRRGFVALGTAVSFLAIVMVWLAFNPLSSFRPHESPKAEIAGAEEEKNPSQRSEHYPSDTSAFSAPLFDEESSLGTSHAPTPSITPAENDYSIPSNTAIPDPLFREQGNFPSAPEL